MNSKPNVAFERTVLRDIASNLDKKMRKSSLCEKIRYSSAFQISPIFSLEKQKN